MASTSASSIIQKSFKYEVFLSFRGEDTRKNFVDHLYHALHQRGIITYKDDIRIQKGEKINDQLITSIQDSRFHIIVFSKNYASSSWCLDELVKIMECQKTSEQTAFPLFYDVEPTHVRNQSGPFGEAFAKHVTKEAAGRWRDALKQAADLAGWELKNTGDGHEVQFIKKVVEDIFGKLHFTNVSFNKKLVGMETRVKNVLSSLEVGCDDVRMIGIKGMGGGGKTTLARVIFDHISGHFEGRCFVENVREGSKASGLKELQQHVLQDALSDQGILVRSISDGMHKMEKMMPSRKVILVLDDVDHLSQLEALVGELTWFKAGSRIIITTRDKHLLVAHGLQSNNIHDVNLLTEDEAICLLSRYAFRREVPDQGYEQLSREVVHYAAGLPLTIKVLGSDLCGRTSHEWKDVIERLKTIPEEQTLERLELSYVGLKDDQKEIFLEVACILKGEREDEAMKILRSCGYHAEIGLKVLEEKSLINISLSGKLDLHDLIEEMGMNIVRRSHPDEPERHSRLWIQEEIDNILINDLGTGATKSIKLEYPILHPTKILQGLTKMSKLRSLYIISERVESGFDEVGGHLPYSLQSLIWHGYPFRCLPKTFQADNLVNLGMSSSTLSQLWEGGERKVLNCLRFLKLGSSKLRIFDLGMTPNLEILYLFDSQDLEELQMPAECLQLKILHVHRTKLNNLNLVVAPHLEELHLISCDELVELHMPAECPQLKTLELWGSKLNNLNLVMAPHLEQLVLESCDELVELHMPAECPQLKTLELWGSKLNNLNLVMAPHLEELHLRSCDELVELHMPAECPQLKTLELWGSKLNNLNLVMAPHLEELHLRSCDELVELHMPAECPQLKILRIDRTKLNNLNLVMAPHLEELHLRSCDELVELHMPAECPQLKTLQLWGSKLNNLNLVMAPHLEQLVLKRCDELVELHMPAECPQLKTLQLTRSKLHKLNLVMAQHLEELHLNRCHELVELHMPAECPQLKILRIDRTKLNNLNLVMAPHLEELHLRSCDELVELHMPAECPQLKTLQLWGSKLNNLNLVMAPHLEQLVLERCDELVELHMPAECPQLKTLQLTRSKLHKLNLVMAQHLEELHLNRCHELVELHMPAECPQLKILRIDRTKLNNLNLVMAPHLEELHLRSCDELVELHMPAECPQLKTLQLWGSKLNNLNLVMAPHLEQLVLERCDELVELHMPAECPQLKTLQLTRSKLHKLNLVMAQHLEELHLNRYHELVELHMPAECPQLKILELYGSKLNNLNLVMAPHLEELYLKYCDELVELNMPAECPHLKILKVNGSKLRNLNLELTPNLKELQLEDCFELADLNMPIEWSQLRVLRLSGFKVSSFRPGLTPLLEKSEHLEELSLHIRDIKHLPDGIWISKNLKTLSLHSCWLLDQLPEHIGRAERLELLDLTDCISLRDIPNSICNMKYLRILHLSYCFLVEKLPEEFGRLESLKCLNIEGAAIQHLPQSLFQLKGLRIEGHTWRLESYGFATLHFDFESYKDYHHAFCFIKS